MIDWLRADGAKVRTDLVQKRNYKVFTDGVVLIYSLIGRLVHGISPTAFAHKYKHGMPRPEEVIGAWARGEYQVSSITDRELRRYVNVDEVLKDQRRFTMYPEGSPNHPSLGAMHSALASAALIFPIVFDLTDSQQQQCIKVTGATAYGRTMAGVHYCQDNSYGLEMGEKAVAKILPDFLSVGGFDKVAVRELCKVYTHDWSVAA